MEFFVDSSVLVKLIHPETDSDRYRTQLLPGLRDGTVWASSISPIEVVSALAKLVRIKKMAGPELAGYVYQVRIGFSAARLIELDVEVVGLAQSLLVEYAVPGLRALDAIQLASAVKAKSFVAKPEQYTFISADHTLLACAKQQGFVIETP